MRLIRIALLAVLVSACKDEGGPEPSALNKGTSSEDQNVMHSRQVLVNRMLDEMRLQRLHLDNRTLDEAVEQLNELWRAECELMKLPFVPVINRSRSKTRISLHVEEVSVRSCLLLFSEQAGVEVAVSRTGVEISDPQWDEID